MQKKLKKWLKKDNSIFDIILYGSSMKGKLKPRDKDVLVIFLEGNLRERLDKIKKIKDDLDIDILDIKQVLFTDIFSSNFLARQGVFIEGFSIKKKGLFSETFGFKPYCLFWYELKGLSHSQKVKFHYILAGRNAKGIIEEFKGERIANGVVKMPVDKSIVFEDILKSNNVSYNKKNILEAI